MKIVLVDIYDRGVLDAERVHFKTVVDLDLKNYAVYETHYTDTNTILAVNSTCFWCPPKTVRANENVVIYTKSGSPSSETKPDGVFHFLFRGVASPLYGGTNSCAVIFEIGEWATSKPLGGVFVPAPSVIVS
jgi:hypothetical protein